jgi:hypothetical protein
LKRLTILLPLSLLVLLGATATGTSIQAFAHTDKYYIGYSQGQDKGTSDYYLNDNGHNDYRPFCPTSDAWTEQNGPHSSNFCAGFIDGYKAAWTSLAPDVMQRIQQRTSQDSTVKINRDNNRVTVNQQVNNNVGGQNSNGSEGNGNGYQPRCAILCSIIKVN